MCPRYLKPACVTLAASLSMAHCLVQLNSYSYSAPSLAHHSPISPPSHDATTARYRTLIVPSYCISGEPRPMSNAFRQELDRLWTDKTRSHLDAVTAHFPVSSRKISSTSPMASAISPRALSLFNEPVIFPFVSSARVQQSPARMLLAMIIVKRSTVVWNDVL